jgi:hypothetical protein
MPRGDWAAKEVQNVRDFREENVKCKCEMAEARAKHGNRRMRELLRHEGFLASN